ncbi:MAG: type II secretion system protein [Planctomycetota bacterium]
MKRSQGFTLIELLVVIGLLSILMVAILPNLLGGSAAAKDAACGLNLKWWYSTIKTYQTTNKKWPSGEGSEMMRNLWNSTAVEKTDANLTRFYCPHQIGEGFYQEFRNLPDLSELWRGSHETIEMDYACRKDRRNWEKGSKAWMSDDNYDGQEWSHTDFSMNILYGDGNVHLYTLDELVQKGILTQEESDDIQSEKSDIVIQVGPQSRIKDLQDLAY